MGKRERARHGNGREVQNGAPIAGSLETFRTGIPLKRIAEPEDAAAVLFLLSDQAAHVTMAEIYVDGGAALRG